MRLLRLAALLPAIAGCAEAGGGRAPIPFTTTIVHLVMLDRHLAVPLELNGHLVEVALDTGSMRSVLTLRAAAAVGALTIAVPGTHDGRVVTVVVAGDAGPSRGTVLFVRQVRFAGAPARAALLLGFPVLPLGDSRLVGLVGADVLRDWDLDLDVASGLLLLDHRQAGRVVPPWHDITTRLAIIPAPDAGIRVPVSVDGHELVALLDTGANFSLGAGDTPAGREFAPADRRSIVLGVGGTAAAVRVHRYRDFSMGDLSFGPVTMLVGQRLGPGVDMLIGLDLLRRARFYVAYGARQLLVEEEP